MQKLSKAEFMHKVINDKYDKKYAIKQKSLEVSAHIIQNINRIQRRIK